MLTVSASSDASLSHKIFFSSFYLFFISFSLINYYFSHTNYSYILLAEIGLPLHIINFGIFVQQGNTYSFHYPPTRLPPLLCSASSIIIVWIARLSEFNDTEKHCAQNGKLAKAGNYVALMVSFLQCCK